MLPPIPPNTTAQQARAILNAAGWREIAQGDWSWVFASADDRLAARVVPFDPAFRLFADAALAGPRNPFLIRIDAVVPLRRKGYITLMERLYPPDEPEARRLVASIGITDQTRPEAPGPAPADLIDHPDIAALRHRILSLLAEGATRFRLWGGSDIRPGNVLRTADGHHKLTDPVFIRGLDILKAIDEGNRDRLADFTRADLEDFLTIQAFKPGPETDALGAKVAALFA